MTSPPDWNLAPLRRFPATLLHVTDADDAARALLKKFTLMLAVVFNDLKDLSWLSYQAMHGDIPADEVSPRAGQKYGMKVTIERWAQGIIFEFFLLLERNRTVLDNKVLRKILGKVPAESSDAWSELVALALKKPGCRVE